MIMGTALASTITHAAMMSLTILIEIEVRSREPHKQHHMQSATEEEPHANLIFSQITEDDIMSTKAMILFKRSEICGAPMKVVGSERYQC